MHIDDLIRQITPHLPFQTVQQAEQVLTDYVSDDKIALISAMYIGQACVDAGTYALPDEYGTFLLHRGMDRYWYRDMICDEESPYKLYTIGPYLKIRLEAFQRCTSHSGYDRACF